MDEIKLIPDVPDEIISASENEELVVFIGAGVSRLVNCLGWDQLSANLIKACYNHYGTDGKRLINNKAKLKLESIKDHRKVISICYSLLDKNGFVNVFDIEMDKALQKNIRAAAPNIYSDLAKLKALFVTTNTDEQFDYFFETPFVKFKIEHLKDQPRNEHLYHIHGSLKERRKLVFRLTEYFDRYNNNDFKLFLSELNKKTILFIGYGLAEFELLEYLYKNKSVRKHFLLNGYYSGEEDYLRLEQTYYDEMGITVKPYLLDVDGYNQLNNVIKEWVNRILTSSTTAIGRYKLIDEAIEV